MSFYDYLLNDLFFIWSGQPSPTSPTHLALKNIGETYTVLFVSR